MIHSKFLITVTIASLLAGCFAAEPHTIDTGSSSVWQGEPEQGPADEVTIRAAILEFVNTATPKQLDNVLNRRASRSIHQNRPFSSVSSLADAAYVGNSALTAILEHVTPGAVSDGAGFWLEVLLDSTQVDAVLAMANVLELKSFNCDLGFGASRAARIVDNRPYATVDSLLAVPYIAKSVLTQLKANVTWWLDGSASAGERFDCVLFTPEQASAALDVVNFAGMSELCSAGDCGFAAWARQVSIIMNQRSWGSLDDLERTSYIGPSAMYRVRSLADRLLAGDLDLVPDSIQRLVAEGGDSSYVWLSRVRSLGSVAAGGFRKPGVSYWFHTCARVADYEDPTPEAPGHSALVCTADSGCEGLGAWFKDRWDGYAASGEVVNLRKMRWFVEPTYGVVIYDTPWWCI